MTRITYPITGMTCQKCVAKVQAALAPFADHVEVQLAPPQVTLTHARGDLKALNKALDGHYQLGVTAPKKSWWQTYYPLLLIVGYIAVVSSVADNTHDWMLNFMAGFFLVFSFFKMLDLRGFATAYAGYDLLAARSRAYALAYPFIELALGLSYLFRIAPDITNVITLIVMVFSGLGVVRVLVRRQTIRCACLGAVFNLPMSTVTIIEDFGMAAMALWMLLAA